MERDAGHLLPGEPRRFEPGDLGGGVAVGGLQIEVVFPLVSAGWSRAAGGGAARAARPIVEGGVLNDRPTAEIGLEAGGVFGGRGKGRGGE